MTRVPGNRASAAQSSGRRRRGGLGVVVAGHERDGRGRVAVRDRDARVRRDPDPRGHPRHDLHRDPRGVQVLGLLGPTAEDERVAPLEPDHPAALACVLDQQGVDLLLRHGAVADRLARADPEGGGGGQVEQARARQVVVDHHVGPRQDLGAPAGQQAGIARPGPDQIDDPPRPPHPSPAPSIREPRINRQGSPSPRSGSRA